MKKITVAAGKTAEIIIDAAKDKHVSLEVEKSGNANVFVINRGGANSGAKLSVNLIGKKAVVKVASLVIGTNGNPSNNEIEINHSARETTSSFTGYALLQNNAEHCWGVTTVIERVAKKSVASQRINNLLLGKNGVVKNRPALLIHNNDVACSHAVATGHLDEEQLFYARARGLTQSQSKNLLARGFAEPFLQLLPKCFEQELGAIIDNLLQENNV